MLVPSLTGTILRLRGQLELRCHLDTTDVSRMHKAVSETFETLRSQVQSESCALAVCDSPVVIWPTKTYMSHLRT
ncbi:unnamed protein product [Pleuronectes platessa]|uniref:UFSP2 second domain-containing protein n=1 Tax=Pleuronectes platessa TaxID=8262 RepID=A0A9N7YNQ2_PLEPL|nr:unnamed protein product [Pleuronectes platessa]